MPAPRPSPREIDDYDRRIDALRNAARRAEAEGRSPKALEDAARRLIAERDRRK